MLTVPADRVTATLAMPCGPRLTSAGGFGAYVVATLRLARPGARCGSARRRVARLAIRVGHRRITELYRLHRPTAAAGAHEAGSRRRPRRAGGLTPAYRHGSTYGSRSTTRSRS